MKNSTSSHSLAKDQFVLHSGWQNMVEALGLSVIECLSRAKLASSIAEQEHPHLTTEELLRLWDVMEALVGPESILSSMRSHCGTSPPPSDLAAISSEDLRSAILNYAALKRLSAPLEIALHSDGEGTSVTVDWLVEPDRPSHSLIILILARILDVAERGSGRRISPLRVECVNANEIPGTLAEKHLGVPLEKGPRMRLVFAEHDMEQSFQTRNPQTLKILDRYLEDTTAKVEISRTRDVLVWLKRLLPGGRYDVAVIARQLACSVRQLQRELAAEGTSFSDLLYETRRELALNYLARDRFTPEEVTLLLGYSEPSSFYRAFRQWTRETPNQYAARTRELAGCRDEP